MPWWEQDLYQCPGSPLLSAREVKRKVDGYCLWKTLPIGWRGMPSPGPKLHLRIPEFQKCCTTRFGRGRWAEISILM